MTIGGSVEAYAGARYPERPLRVLWRNRWRTIAEVEHQEQHPDRPLLHRSAGAR